MAITLAKFKEIIDKAVENAGDCANTAKVLVWIGKKEYEVDRIGQFGLIPNVTITVGKKLYEDDE